MSFVLSKEAREEIAETFLAKNDVDFGCITKYEQKNIGLSNKLNVLLECGYSNTQVIESVVYHNITNFIQNSFFSALDKVALLFNLATQRDLFYDENLKILSDATHRHKLYFNPKSKREDLEKEIFNKLEMKIDSNRLTPVRQVLDELVMNAQLDAPKLSTARNVNQSVLIVERTDNLISISVIDYYGTLDVKRFLKKIEGSLKLGQGDAINYSQHKGGAGLGSSIIYNHSDMLLMGCKRLKITRVTSVLPYNISEKKFSSIQKSISIID
ncbi:MAG: hypothetical protein AABY53_06380 [Bdellovibrionota bacterium]